MARTHAQRRRQNVILLVALVATLLVLLFARDVNRAAHNSTAVRRSENRSFARLTNSLLDSEQLFGDHLGYLLTHGATLSRPVFAARLEQLALQLPTWTSDANLLRRPGIAHDLNTVVDQLTDQRVVDYQVVLDSVATSLDLPWRTLNSTGLTSVAARSSLLATDRAWNAVRNSLLQEPGGVKLSSTSTPSSVVTLPTTLGALSNAPALQVQRAVAISAIEVTPSPLPAPTGQIVLPPVSTFRLGVSVTNDAFVLQPVTLTVTLTALSGAQTASQHQAMSVILGPDRSYAFLPRHLATLPGEHARLTVTLSGARGATAATTRRSYLVILSPAVAVTATFSAQPTNTTTGVATRAQVTVLDGLGHPVAHDTVAMALSSGPGSFTFHSRLTATTNAAGVATFTKLAFTKPGVYTLTAIDGSAVVSSNSFTVTGAALSSADRVTPSVIAIGRVFAVSRSRATVTGEPARGDVAARRASSGPTRSPRRSYLAFPALAGADPTKSY